MWYIIITERQESQKRGEQRNDVKKDVDAFVIEMIEKYPEILTSTTLQNLMEKEIGIAFVEIEDDGRIHSMKERWG